MSWRVVRGDCVEQLRELDEASVDAVVCDPPYGLEFMGKEWDRLDAGSNNARWAGRRTGTDAPERTPETPGGRHGAAVAPSRPNRYCESCEHYQFSSSPCCCESPRWAIRPNLQAPRMQAWHERWATEALRVLKPGGHLLAFGGSRTAHRLACGIEDAGFEIRDTVCWLYGSGFPKSLNVSAAIDKQAGAEREVVGRRDRLDQQSKPVHRMGYSGPMREQDDALDITAPATPEAERWQGWGTALKPAHEPIVVARKPLAGTVAGNVLEHGTGALNVDGCRIGTPEDKKHPGTKTYQRYDPGSPCKENQVVPPYDSGRWPANVVLDEEAARLLDEQTGELTSGSGKRNPHAYERDGVYGVRENPADGYERSGDSGGASRYFKTVHGSIMDECAGLVSNAELDSMHDREMSSAASGGSAPGSAGGKPTEPTQDEPTPGATSASPTDAGIASGATPEAASSGSSSNTDGSGSRPTEPSQADTTSTIGTRTRSTTTSGISNSSKQDGTSGTTEHSEPPRLSETESGSAPGAESGSRLGPSQPALPAPDSPTAESAGPSTCASGEHGTGSGTTPTCVPIDSGSETRFRYQSKASRAERNAGLEGFEKKRTHRYSEKGQGPLPQQTPSVGVVEGNHHPTVKPIELMRWLVRLVTPPGGTVLDPFAGSGTTGVACALENFDFLGIEREPEYADIAEARIGWWEKHRGDGQAAAVLAAGEVRDQVEAQGQTSLFEFEDSSPLDRTNREGEVSADRRYAHGGSRDFNMKPGKRRVA